jgi:hypothetical protein
MKLDEVNIPRILREIGYWQYVVINSQNLEAKSKLEDLKSVGEYMEVIGKTLQSLEE